MLRSCSRCGRIHEPGQCSLSNRRRITEVSRERRFRSSNAWTRKSREIRERDGYLCAGALRENPPRYVTTGLSVHHIEPLNECWDRRLDDTNLITLSQYYHEQAEAGLIDRATLHGWADHPLNLDQ